MVVEILIGLLLVLHALAILEVWSSTVARTVVTPATLTEGETATQATLRAERTAR
jgi:hypothetical protein